MTDDLDSRLREAFARHADDAGDTVTLAGVETTRRRVRRRRGSVVVAAVAVAAAVGVTVPALVGPDSPQAAPAGPSTPSTPSTALAGTSSALAVSPVTTGYLASLPLDGEAGTFVVGNELVRPDGRRVPLPETAWRAPWGGGAVVGEDVLLTRPFDGPAGLGTRTVRVAPDGTAVDAWFGSGAVTSGDGSRVAWWRSSGLDTSTGDVVVATDGDAGTVVQSGVKAAVPLGFRADGSVLLDHIGTSLPFGGIDVHDVDDRSGRVSGQRTAAPPAEHGAVVEADGDIVFASDRWQTWEFSPDGRWVVGVNSATGGDPGAVAVLDATTGAVRSELPLLSPGRSLGLRQHRVNDRGELDVVVSESVSRWQAFAVVRLRVDGTVVRLTPVVRWASRRIGDSPIVMLD